MKTDDDGNRIAIQPETEVEQALVKELFTRLNNIADAPAHPSKVGSALCFYTLDVGDYGGLNHDLWLDAECNVNEHGQLDPEPGSRALIVVHTKEDAESEPAPETEDESEEYDGPTIGDFAPEEAEVAEELAADDDLTVIEELEYDELQEYAKRIGVAANQSAEDLRDILWDLVSEWERATGRAPEAEEVEA